jgi:hypothetical protein
MFRSDLVRMPLGNGICLAKLVAQGPDPAISVTPRLKQRLEEKSWKHENAVFKREHFAVC